MCSSCGDPGIFSLGASCSALPNSGAFTLHARCRPPSERGQRVATTHITDALRLRTVASPYMEGREATGVATPRYVGAVPRGVPSGPRTPRSQPEAAANQPTAAYFSLETRYVSAASHRVPVPLWLLSLAADDVATTRTGVSCLRPTGRSIPCSSNTSPHKPTSRMKRRSNDEMLRFGGRADVTATLPEATPGQRSPATPTALAIAVTQGLWVSRPTQKHVVPVPASCALGAYNRSSFAA